MENECYICRRKESELGAHVDLSEVTEAAYGGIYICDVCNSLMAFYGGVPSEIIEEIVEDVFNKTDFRVTIK